MTGGSPESGTGAGSADSAPVLLATSARRVVLDTNVLVSLYIFADSRFAPLRTMIDSGAWLAITNDVCFDEFRRVLGYPLFALTDERQQSALTAYGESALRHAAPAAAATATISLPRCKDRDDQKFLELARDSAADWLVTGDKAMLRLARRDRLRGLFRILSPEAALAEK